MPQSNSSFFPAASTRYFEPVTVPAAPKKVSFAIACRSLKLPANDLTAFAPQNKTHKQSQRYGWWYTSIVSLRILGGSVPDHSVIYRDIAMVFAAAFFCGLIAWRLRQPILLGYVLAELILSPLTPGPHVHDVGTFETMAEIGENVSEEDGLPQTP